MKTVVKKQSYAFIDASNLFYGGARRLGWRVDYKKLAQYMERKYNVRKIYYYSGVEAYGYEVKLKSTDRYPIEGLLKYLENMLGRTYGEKRSKLKRDIAKVKFLRKIGTFGYVLRLKAIKHIRTSNGSMRMKANCDVDLTFDMIRLENEYNFFLLLSGDGDFEILLRYLEERSKKFLILANAKNTARIYRYGYSDYYREFSEIKELIEDV